MSIEIGIHTVLHEVTAELYFLVASTVNPRIEAPGFYEYNLP